VYQCLQWQVIVACGNHLRRKLGITNSPMRFHFHPYYAVKFFVLNNWYAVVINFLTVNSGNFVSRLGFPNNKEVHLEFIKGYYFD